MTYDFWKHLAQAQATGETWRCRPCGRENPDSYDTCHDCHRPNPNGNDGFDTDRK